MLNKTPLFAAVVLTLTLSGCGSDSPDQPRGGLAKADLLGTCSAPAGGDFCGGPSDGDCHCDDQCIGFGDCCDDKAEGVHSLSPRCGNKLMRVNCAAFSESLVESELFGHVKGAFTGALQDKPGLFEACSGGTLFLDEIGDLPLSLQAKLLRVLEDGKVRRVGSLDDIPVDVRIIAATHRDLEADVLLKTFRQDLFFRLNGISIHIPPLRDRPEEIEPFARMFLTQTCATQNLGPPPTISNEALEQLCGYAWPGNLRELRNAIERASLLAVDGIVEPEHLPVEKMQSESMLREHVAAPERLPEAGLREDLDAREREIIVAALERAGGNQSQAARDLGISRGTLIDRIKAYGLPRPRKKDRT